MCLAVAISPLLREGLYDEKPFDFAVYALVAMILAATGILASAAPTLRAIRVHPMEALRYE
jgi:ABC-type lipoprotein release transport system permease subunit